MDGNAKAVTQVDTHFKNKYDSCAVFINLKKAFDSVSHTAIQQALILIGAPEHFIKYIMYVYKTARTNRFFAGQSSEPDHPQPGVRQGDPLSSTLLLPILDFVLRELPDTYGALLNEDGRRISYNVYADDLLHLARDSSCLQTLLNLLHTLLPPTSLAVNTAKYLVFSWIADKKHKKVLLDEQCIFTLGSLYLRALKFRDSFHYFGVEFMPDRHSCSMPNVSDDLETLKAAPLKPFLKNLSSAIVLPSSNP